MPRLFTRGLWIRSLWIIALCGASGGIVWLTTSLTDAEESRFAPLIERLGHEEFAQREAATEELQTIGEPALPELRRTAAEHADLETRLRARQLVVAILLALRTSKTTGMEMALIESGAMTMGSPEGEAARNADEAAHRVRITQSFLLGKLEVTQAEYEKVMGTNPSFFGLAGPGKAQVPDREHASLPVERVTWFDAIAYCNRLSELDGLKPYYSLADVRRDGATIKSASVTIAGGHGYRLPTEAEWEYACRAGTSSMYHYGGGRNGELSNVKGQTFTGYGGTTRGPDLQRTCRVGRYPPNSFGLLDMHGNVAEWCWDWYDRDYYKKSPADDPFGPAGGTQKVLRGGSWLLNETAARSAARGVQTPDEVKEFAGFRVARSP
jgi:formylglycine-generating enzyme required for sulfatase activity